MRQTTTRIDFPRNHTSQSSIGVGRDGGIEEDHFDSRCPKHQWANHGKHLICTLAQLESTYESFSSFEAHTKRIGSKSLQKMGFNGQGIASMAKVGRVSLRWTLDHNMLVYDNMVVKSLRVNVPRQPQVMCMP
jgi:hypothetical protein